MVPTTNLDMVINGIPAMWAYPIEKVSDKYQITGIVGADTAAKQAARFRFNTIQGNPTIGLVRPEAVTNAATEEFLDILLANNVTIQFSKNKLTLSGADGSIKGGTGVTADGGTKGTISVVTSGGDIDSAGNYVTYLDKIKTYIGSKFVVCIPIGYNLDKKSAAGGSDVKPIGYAFMIGTLSADLSHAVGAYSPATLTWSFASASWAVTASEWKTSHAAFDLGVGDASSFDTDHCIVLMEGIDGSGNVSGTVLLPPDIAVLSSGAFTANFQKLLDGEVVFLEA